MQTGLLTLSAVVAFTSGGIGNISFGQCTAEETQELSSVGIQDQGNFGTGVCLRADLVIVGAPGPFEADESPGSAKILRQSSIGWQEETILLSSDGANDDQFGFAVAIEDQIAAVGAPFQTTSPLTAQGAVYVFELDGTEWEEEAKLIGSETDDDSQFGYSISVSDGRIVVGSPLEDETASDSGVVYVFEKVGGVWQETALLEASDAALTDRFGWSVAIDGDVIIVGTPLKNTTGGSNAGAAYVFRHNGTSWVEEAIVTALDGATFDEFGDSVDVRGDLAIVGAHFENPGGIGNAGAAYIFHFNESSWVQQIKLIASDGELGDEFGISVSIDDDIAAVGAFRSDGDEDDSGAAYVFSYTGSTWEEIAKLVASNGLTDSQLGSAVSLDGSTLAVGEPDSEYEVEESRSFIFASIASDCDDDETLDICELTTGGEQDCNLNGVPDACDIADETSEDCNENGIPDECDFADGTSKDCNGNGIPDECDIADQTSEDCNENIVPDECEVPHSIQILSIVVVFDTSGSQEGTPVSGGEGDFCDRMDDLVTELDAGLPSNITLDLTLWGIIDEGIWSCLTGNVTDEICTGVGVPTACSPSLGVEDWGRASTAVAEAFSWQNADGRIIIPFSDEAPDGGDACSSPGTDADVIEAAIEAMNTANVIALPVLGRDPISSKEACIIELMDDLAEGTGGERFDSESSTLIDDLADWILDHVDTLASDCDDDGIPDECENDCDCDGVPDDCDTEPDNDENGIPDNCDLCSGCAPDLDDDGMIGFSDLLLLLDAWDTSDEDADLDESGTVGFQDLLILLDAWGPCEEERACPCEPLSLEEALAAACLDEDDFDDYVDVIDSGTQQDKDRYECWFEAYLNGGGSCDPPNSCPTPDPFAE